MSPDELVRATLDLEAQFLEELGEHEKAEAVRDREPAEPAPPPHSAFAPPFRVFTAAEDAGIYKLGPEAWGASQRSIEPPRSVFLADHFVRFIPDIPPFFFHPVEDSASTEES